jgi:hypothetical protein
MILSINLSCDAITGGTDFDIGVYNTIRRGGAVVSRDCFLDGQTLATALREANGFTKPNIDSLDKPVWELAGLSADPATDFELCLTGVAVGSATGTVTLRVQYR